MKYIRLIFCLGFFLSGCLQSDSPHAYSYGDEMELKMNEKVTLEEDEITIQFVDVVGDSRCPQNVTCVWAGNGEIEIRINHENVRLNTYMDPKEGKILGTTIELVALLPYPVYQKSINTEDYKVRILITKN